MLIDCETCAAPDLYPDDPGRLCRDCVVTALLKQPTVPVEIDADERYAIALLADAGLVPPLRVVSDSSGSGREIA
jgi:hypothetical protein